MKPGEIAEIRLHNQRLSGRVCKTPAEVVGWFGAMQSQDYPGAQWSIAQRLDQPTTKVALDKAFARGDILRTHLLRPTWHFVLPEDIRWMLALTAPRVQAMVASYRNRQLGLSDAELERTNELIAGLLAGGKQMTRRELVALLNEKNIDTSGQRIAFIVMHAEMTAVICSGGLKGKQHTYALLSERVGTERKLAGDEALAELAYRYFASHGPATLKDYMWWSSLTSAQAKCGVQLLGKILEHVTVDGREYHYAALRPITKEPADSMHLLQGYDEYVVAYTQSKDVFNRLPPSLPRAITWATNALVLDGQVVGVWRRLLKPKGIELQPKVFVELTARQRAGLERAAADYGRFMGLPVRMSAI